MSGRATFWACSLTIKPATAKYVLLCLAHCHNKTTSRCDPSVEFIAQWTGLDRKTIPRAIARLTALELILVKKRGKHSPKYELMMEVKEVSPENGRWHTPKTEAGIPENGHTNRPKAGNEPIKESKKKPKKNLWGSLDCSAIPDEILEPVKEFISYRQSLRKPLTPEGLKRFIKAVYRSADVVGITPGEVITETIDAGWQSVKANWLLNRLGDSNAQTQPQPGRNTGTYQQPPRLTPAQRTDAIRQKQRARELAEQSPTVGTVAKNGRDVRAPVGVTTGRYPK